MILQVLNNVLMKEIKTFNGKFVLNQLHVHIHRKIRFKRADQISNQTRMPLPVDLLMHYQGDDEFHTS